MVFGKILLCHTCGIYIAQASKWFDKAEQKTKVAFLLYAHLKKQTNKKTQVLENIPALAKILEAILKSQNFLPPPLPKSLCSHGLKN